MPEIQLDQSTIDRLVRPILGRFDDSEDSYQDVQLRILERLPRSEEEIRAIAREVKKEYTRDYLHSKHNIKSIYEPLGGNGNGHHTIERFLTHEKKDEPEEEVNTGDTPERLLLTFLVNELVAGRSLNWSILSLLRTSAELLRRHHRKWEQWEDEIMREKYTRGGSLAVAFFLDRTVNAITSRACYLKIRRYRKEHWNSEASSSGQQQMGVETEQAGERRRMAKEQRRLESQRVREERLRANEKRRLEWKRITVKYARIREQKRRLK